MKALSLSAGVLAAAFLVSAMPAAAADLDYRYVPPPDRHGSAYEDPRYRDIYGPEPSRPYAYAPHAAEPRYEERAPLPPPGPVPPGYVYGERQSERYGAERYASRFPRDEPRHVDGCLRPGEIKRRLHEDGWSEFRDVDANGRVARIRARRANGDLFALRLDRCTGDILKTVLIGRDGAGPYASRDDSRRYDRRYY
jgi:hypothetical protein